MFVQEVRSRIDEGLSQRRLCTRTYGTQSSQLAFLGALFCTTTCLVQLVPHRRLLSEGCAVMQCLSALFLVSTVSYDKLTSDGREGMYKRHIKYTSFSIQCSITKVSWLACLPIIIIRMSDTNQMRLRRPWYLYRISVWLYPPFNNYEKGWVRIGYVG